MTGISSHPPLARDNTGERKDEFTNHAHETNQLGLAVLGLEEVALVLALEVADRVYGVRNHALGKLEGTGGEGGGVHETKGHARRSSWRRARQCRSR